MKKYKPVIQEDKYTKDGERRFFIGVRCNGNTINLPSLNREEILDLKRLLETYDSRRSITITYHGSTNRK